MAGAGPAVARLRREYELLQKDTETSGVTAVAREDSLRAFDCTIKGPSETPYEGGIFRVDVQIPDQYPFAPPKMRFVTRLWHPNVSSATGAICLDILKNEWSPALTIKTALISLQALLSAPEPSDPQDAVVARQYQDDYPRWEATAREWTERYAHDGETEEDKMVEQMVGMGFDSTRSRNMLREHDGNLERAVAAMLGSM